MLGLGGCAPSADDRSAVPAANSQEVSALKSQLASMTVQLDGLRLIMEQTTNHPPVATEPAGDVDEGFYMANITDVTTSAAGPVLSIDFVSDENYPKTDSHIWNKHQHMQRVPLDMDPDVPPVVILNGSDGPIVVPPSELVSRFRQLQASDELGYYVDISGGKASRIWPVPFP